MSMPEGQAYALIPGEGMVPINGQGTPTGPPLPLEKPPEQSQPSSAIHAGGALIEQLQQQAAAAPQAPKPGRSNKTRDVQPSGMKPGAIVKLARQRVRAIKQRLKALGKEQSALEPELAELERLIAAAKNPPPPAPVGDIVQLKSANRSS